MGYRSQVTSAVVFADAAHNTKAMVAWKLHCAAENKKDPLASSDDGDHGLGEHITFPVIADKWPCILLTNKDKGNWKWYDGYTDVDAWHYFIAWMNKTQDVATVFIRIGEENDDVVEQRNESTREDMRDFYVWDFFGINRSIRIGI